MQADPMEEWRRLATLYSEMGEVEIRELADRSNDLTPHAQQILRSELEKRGFNKAAGGKVESAGPFPQNTEAEVHWEPANYAYEFSDLPDETKGPHDYTWKTELCTCNASIEAWQIGELLRRAGIDCWIQQPRSRGGLDGPRLLVAADQLERARTLSAQPIPQEIIDEANAMKDAESWENPVCPRCRAADPTLESVEPSNNWLCETCGYTWSDPVDDTEGAKTGS